MYEKMSYLVDFVRRFRKELVSWSLILVIVIVFSELNGQATMKEQYQQNLLNAANVQVQTLSTTLRLGKQQKVKNAKQEIDSLPISADIPGIVLSIDHLATQANVRIVSFDFNKPSSTGVAGSVTGAIQSALSHFLSVSLPSSNQNHVPIQHVFLQLSIQGTRDDLLQFVKHLEHETRPTAINEIDFPQEVQVGASTIVTVGCAVYYRTQAN